MTSVENPTINPLLAYGVPTANTTGAAEGLISESTVNSADFEAYLRNVSGTELARADINNALSPEDLALFAQERNAGLPVAPTDAWLSVNPAAQTTPQSTTLNTIVDKAFSIDDATSALEKVSESGDGVPSEHELSVGFQATSASTFATINELTGNSQSAQVTTSGQTLSQTSQPKPEFAPITEQAILAPGQMDNHIIPAAELEALTIKAGTETPTAALPAQTMAAATTGATTLNTTVQTPENGSSKAAPTLNAELQATNLVSSEPVPNSSDTIAPAQVEPTKIAPAAGKHPNIGSKDIQEKLDAAQAEAEMDADGQILAVAQKANKAAATGQSQSTQTASQNQTATAQTAAATAGIVDNGSTRKPNSSSEPQKSAPLAVSSATPTPENAPIVDPKSTVPPAMRASNDSPTSWSGAWTPERAAGLSDTMNYDLIATGLSGLKSDGGSAMAMGLVGGRPNPMLGGQVAKQLNVNITRAVKAGESEFSMRMDPGELGRVTVKLKFQENGMVRANVFVERPETMELLQRDMRGLERAIEAGGHKAEAGGIEFSLDSGGEESAGRAFAEAMQEDQLKDQNNGQQAGNEEGSSFTDEGEMTEEISLEEILAHVTPETGVDVHV
jgi:hypothetical protein